MITKEQIDLLTSLGRVRMLKITADGAVDAEFFDSGPAVLPEPPAEALAPSEERIGDDGLDAKEQEDLYGSPMDGK